MDKVLSKVLSPVPGGLNMTTGMLLAFLFLVGFAMGGHAVETGEDIDISAEVTAEMNAEAEAAVADAEGYQKPAARGLYYGMAIPLMHLLAPIAEGGYAVGYWMASAVGVGITATIAEGMTYLVMLAIGARAIQQARHAEVA